MEDLEVLQEFIVDSIGLIASSKQLQGQAWERAFGMQSESTDLIRDSIRKQWSSKRHTCFLDLVQQIESCYPLLIERWQFQISQNMIIKHISSKKEISESLSVVGETSALIHHSNLNGLTMRFSDSISELINWDSEAKPLLKESIVKMETAEKVLRVSVEHLDLPVKPKLLMAKLGLRPRLVSFDVEDLGLSRTSSFSDLNVKGFVNNRRLSLIKSEGILEERDIGFKFIGSELDSDRLSDSNDEDSFELKIQENSPQDDLSEDVKIASYTSLCKLALKSKAFNGTDNILRQISASVAEWKNIKQS